MVDQEVYIVMWSWHPSEDNEFYLEDDMHEDRAEGRIGVDSSKYSKSKETRIRTNVFGQKQKITLDYGSVAHIPKVENFDKHGREEFSWIPKYINASYKQIVLDTRKNNLMLLMKKFKYDVARSKNSRKASVTLKASTAIMFDNLLPDYDWRSTIKYDKRKNRYQASTIDIQRLETKIQKGISSAHKSIIKNKAFIESKKDWKDKIKTMVSSVERSNKYYKGMLKGIKSNKKVKPKSIMRLLNDMIEKSPHLFDRSNADNVCSSFPDVDFFKNEFKYESICNDGVLRKDFISLIENVIQQNKLDIDKQYVNVSLIEKCLHKDYYYSGGSRPSHTTSLPLKNDDKYSVKANDNGLDFEKILQKMNSIATGTKFFNLKDYNCSNTAGEIITAGIAVPKLAAKFKYKIFNKFATPQSITKNARKLQNHMFFGKYQRKQQFKKGRLFVWSKIMSVVKKKMRRIPKVLVNGMKTIFYFNRKNKKNHNKNTYGNIRKNHMQKQNTKVSNSNKSTVSGNKKRKAMK